MGRGAIGDADICVDAFLSVLALASARADPAFGWRLGQQVKLTTYGVNGILLLACPTLGDALQKSGANAWFASVLAPVLTTLPTAVVIFAVVAISFTITQFINNVALGAILTPVLMGVALASGVPPERLVLPAIISLGLAFTFPGGSARMTLVAVSGAVERREMVRVGFLIALPSAFLVALYFTVLGVLGLI